MPKHQYEALDAQARFDAIYTNERWKCEETLCGSGSTADNIKEWGQKVMSTVQCFAPDLIVDIGCGDCGAATVLSKLWKCGEWKCVDIVDEKLTGNRRNSKAISCRLTADLTKAEDWKKLGDLSTSTRTVFLLRDILMHLKDEEIRSLMQNIASRSIHIIV